MYYKTKKMVIVDPRDFVLILHFNKTPSGVLYALAMHADRDELIPESKGIVRGILYMGGWRLEPLDENRTKCEYIAEIDIKLNIPGFIMKQVIKDQGYQVVKLRKAVEVFLADSGQL